MVELKGKKVLVVGLGVSGKASALLCQAQGALVRATDRSPAPPAAAELAAAGVSLSLGGHRVEDFAWAQIIVLSPGVDHRLPEIAKARLAGAEVIGELELGWRFARCPMVMITGTNGKSTVTTLLGDILNQAGFKTLVGGNLGRPVCDMVADSADADWLVAEVSSFQTDTMERLRPRVGVVLNITPDHLDRYPGFTAYAASKMSLCKNQSGDDVAVLCAEDPEVWSRRSLAPARVWGYGAAGPRRPGGWLEGGELVLDVGQGPLRVKLPQGHLAIGFNRQNCLAACLAALACGAEAPAMEKALAAYKVLGHRLALVGEKDGVRFYDDSKGTNLGAVIAAVESLDRPVVLLLGGKDKDGRFTDLAPLLGDKVVRVICFGEAGPVIQAQLMGLAACQLAPDLATAVRLAAQAAAPGQAVLLSPGCASFDAYTGYAQRGEHFQALVREVMHG